MPDCDLSGTTICLVRESGVEHGTRIPLQVSILQQAGAVVMLLTSDEAYGRDPGRFSMAVVAPLGVDDSLPDPRRGESACCGVRWRPSLALRRARQWLKRQLQRTVNPTPRQAALRSIAPGVDLFWVVDYQALPSTFEAARYFSKRVLYDTIDLLPEYEWDYIRPEVRELRRGGERVLIGRVHGFVTAAHSYADYYDEKYSDVIGYRRPVVFGNAPESIVARPRQRTGPLKMIFIGNLTFDRPVFEIIEAMRYVRSDAQLVLQGLNRLGDALHVRIRELGLAGRVTVVDPVMPSEVVEAASAHDVGIVALRGVNENERRAETSKLYTCAAAGLAVLASDLPGIRSVVERARCGVLVSGLDPRAWAEQIDRLSDLPEDQLEALRMASLRYADSSRPSSQVDGFLAEVVRALGRGSVSAVPAD